MFFPMVKYLCFSSNLYAPQNNNYCLFVMYIFGWRISTGCRIPKDQRTTYTTCIIRKQILIKHFFRVLWPCYNIYTFLTKKYIVHVTYVNVQYIGLMLSGYKIIISQSAYDGYLDLYKLWMYVVARPPGFYE